MKHSGRYVCAAFICSLGLHTAVAAPSVEQLVAKGEKQAEHKEYDRALKTLGKAAKLDPDAVEVKIAVARVHSWQGKYAQAEQEVQTVLAEYPANADAQSLAAYIDYYQGHLDPAGDKFARVLATYPDNAEAADGLKLVHEAQDEAAGFVWQFDTGYEHSSFARQPQPNWSNEFAQITRFFDNGATAVHARFEHYDEFLTTDTYYEVGVAHRFAPWADALFNFGHTVDASFHPRWRFETGGDLRVMQAADDRPAVWLTLDAKQDDYGTVSVADIDPGLRFEWGNWALSPNLVMVHQWGSGSTLGWNLRLDGPLTDGFGFYAGYANAPETENAVTVYTASAYGGLSYDFADRYTVRLGYTHDDRENSYTRHAVDVSFTTRL